MVATRVRTRFASSPTGYMHVGNLRTALSGKASSPGGAYELSDILGKEESINRIKIGIEKLSSGI